MTLRIGILGGGNISQTHARAVQEIDDATIVAFGGQNLEKISQLAESFGGVAYEDIEAFFNHKPMDMVIIGSPSGLHSEQGIAAAERGLHVLVEKPIAISTEQADALIAACEQAGVKLGVCFQDRVAPDVLRLKELLDAGNLGKPFLASAQVKWYRPQAYYQDSRWRGTWALDGGGALMNQGVHTVDLLLWLMGGVRSVWAKAITAVHNIEVEDTVVAALQLMSGAIATLEAATSVYPGFPRRLEISGSEGTILLENDRLTAVNLRLPVAELPPAIPALQDERSVSPRISDVRGHRTLIEDFLGAVAGDAAPMCDGHQARRSVELIEAIYQSSRTGQPVELAADN